MSAYSEQALVSKLAKLTNAQDSITLLSHWFQYHRRHYRETVATWAKEVKAAPVPRKLNFLYLCNDVVQSTKKKGPEYVMEFQKVLPEVIIHVYRTCPADIQMKVQRLIKVWDEREVFRPEFTAYLKDQISKIPAKAVETKSKAVPTVDSAQHVLVPSLNQLTKVHEDDLRIGNLLTRMEHANFIEIKSDPASLATTTNDLIDSQNRLKQQIAFREKLLTALKNILETEEAMIKIGKDRLEDCTRKLQRLQGRTTASLSSSLNRSSNDSSSVSVNDRDPSPPAPEFEPLDDNEDISSDNRETKRRRLSDSESNNELGSKNENVYNGTVETKESAVNGQDNSETGSGLGSDNSSSNSNETSSLSFNAGTGSSGMNGAVNYTPVSSILGTSSSSITSSFAQSHSQISTATTIPSYSMGMMSTAVNKWAGVTDPNVLLSTLTGGASIGGSNGIMTTSGVGVNNIGSNVNMMNMNIQQNLGNTNLPLSLPTTLGLGNDQVTSQMDFSNLTGLDMGLLTSSTGSTAPSTAGVSSAGNSTGPNLFQLPPEQISDTLTAILKNVESVGNLPLNGLSAALQQPYTTSGANSGMNYQSFLSGDNNAHM